MDGSLARYSIRFPSAPPPNLVAIDGGLFRILTRVETVEAIVGERSRAIKGEPSCPGASRWGTVRHGEANLFGLVRNNIGFLASICSRVDGIEGEPISKANRYTRAAHNKRLRVELVLDLSKIGAVVGIVHVECLEVIDVEIAPRNG